MSRQRRLGAASLIAILIAPYAAVVVPMLLYMDRLNDRERISQNAGAAQPAMAAFTDRLTNDLDLIESYLFNLVYSSRDVQQLTGGADDIARYNALSSLSTQLDNIVQLVPGIDGIWMSLPGGGEAGLITRSAYHGNTLVRQGELRPAILALLSDGAADPAREWLDIDVAGAPCLLYVQRIGDIACGAWINVTYLQQQADAIAFAAAPEQLSFVPSAADGDGW